jgi:hypothetical protein
MELKPKIGIDNLKFGMTQNEILKILGKPDREKTDEDDDNSILWEYQAHQMLLTFYKNEENRFGYFRTINQKVTYNGQKIIFSKFQLAQKEIFGKIISKWEKSEYDFLTTYFNETYWLSLNVDYGMITEIQMGVPFKDEDEYAWPK